MHALTRPTNSTEEIMAGVYERQREQFERFGEPICPPASGAIQGDPVGMTPQERAAFDAEMNAWDGASDEDFKSFGEVFESLQ